MALKLIISAGGKNIRMRDFLDRYFNGIPKHLLPLPNKKTIIEEIIDNAKNFFDEIVISVNHETYPIFRKKLGDLEKITIEIDTHLTGPLGPNPLVVKKVSKIKYYKEDIFFNVFIPTKSVCGYNPNIIGFNINTPETYKKLCAWFRNQNHA